MKGGEGMPGRVESSDQLPPCSRCGGQLASFVRMPCEGIDGEPVQLELCRACDAGSGAAAALLRWLDTGGGHDPSRSREGASLGMTWVHESMAARGWAWQPGASSDLPLYTGPSPHGVG